MHFSSTHQIVPYGDDLMLFVDCETNQGIAAAQRTGENEWTLKAEGVEDRIVKTDEEPCADRVHVVEAHEDSRCAAVHALIYFAEAMLPREAASVMTVREPYRYKDDTKIRIRDER